MITAWVNSYQTASGHLATLEVERTYVGWKEDFKEIVRISLNLDLGPLKNVTLALNFSEAHAQELLESLKRAIITDGII